MDPHRRLELEIRSVRVSYRAAMRHREMRGGAQLRDAQRRAMEMLGDIGRRIPDTEHDLLRQLEEAQADVRAGPARLPVARGSTPRS